MSFTSVCEPKPIATRRCWRREQRDNVTERGEHGQDGHHHQRDRDEDAHQRSSVRSRDVGEPSGIAASSASRRSIAVRAISQTMYAISSTRPMRAARSRSARRRCARHAEEIQIPDLAQCEHAARDD